MTEEGELQSFELENGMECVPDEDEVGKLHCEDPETGDVHEVDAADVEL